MLIRKFLRDLLKNKIQFISIFLMAALSTYIYAGMGSLYHGLDIEQKNYYDKTNFADYIIYSQEGFNNKSISGLLNFDCVKNVEKRYIINQCIDRKNNSTIELNIVDSKYEISKCVIIDGEEISDKKGIWLDYRYAKANDIKVGERISLSFDGYDIIQDIKGLVINPEYIYQVNVDSVIPNHEEMGFAFMTFEGAKELGIDKVNEVVITTKDHKDLKESDILKCIDSYDILKSREDIVGHTMFQDAIDQYKAIGIIFPVAFLAVTILTMLTTITRLVDKQRIEIGTLGTMGLNKGKIYKHYISFGLYPALLGCLLGLLIAPFTLPQMFYETLDRLYTMEEWRARLPLNSIFIVMICVVMCVMVTYITIRKVLKETPAQAIKPKVNKGIDESKLLKSDLVNKMSFSTKWNLIDILKGKIRAVMTVIGIAGCTGLLIAGFGFRDSLNQVVVDQYEKIYKFNTKLVLDTSVIATDMTNNILNSIKNDYSNVDYIYEGNIELKKGEQRKLANLIVEDDVKNICYYEEVGNKIKLDTERINLSRKTADILNVKEGDSIKIRLIGTKDYKDTKVGKIYVSPITQGAVVSRKMYEDLGYKLIYNYALTSEKIKSVLDKEGIIKSITKDKLKSDYEVTKSTLDSISFILMASAVILAIVVLYNLNMLSLYEKQNEFALLKVLGFKSVDIRNLLLKQTVFLVMLGVIIGLPFGIALLKVILMSMGDSVDMMLNISILSFVLAIVITCGISLIMNLLFINNIRKIDMVSSLKNVE